MHNLRQALKYNKKVYIVPQDKLNAIMGEQSKDDSPVNKAATGDAVVDDPPPSRSESVAQWRSLLNPTQLRSALAIMHILGFEPDTDQKERSYLIYTQLEGTTLTNAVDLYHRLTEKEIPLYLIGNKRLRSRIKRLRNSREEGDDSDHPYDSPNDSPGISSGGEEVGGSHVSSKTGDVIGARKRIITRKKKKKQKQVKKVKKPDTLTGDLMDDSGDARNNGFEEGEKVAKEWLHIFG